MFLPIVRDALLEYISQLWSHPLVFVLTFVVPLLLFLAGREPTSSSSLPPLATPSLPILGNALYYKNNPDKFLARQAKILGGVFRINLAGLETTVLTTKESMKQFAFASERVLSSTEANSDFGFRHTLGDRNVFLGPDIHRRIIKSQYYKSAHLEETALKYWEFFQVSFAQLRAHDVNQPTEITDFLATTRRVILQAVTFEMIGCSVVNAYNTIYKSDFVSDFMVFQDLVEECTAKAAVCPEWLASVLFLKDCENKRFILVSKLEEAIRQVTQDNYGAVGKWLFSALDIKNNSGERKFKLDELADIIVGLLFAAHKNAAIAAAQAVLYMLEYDAEQSAVTKLMPLVREESCMIKTAMESRQNILSLLDECKTIHQVVLETIRVTAHSIGAIRKVVAKDGWAFSVENISVSGQSKKYHLPYGTYVGVSHIVPHRNVHSWGPDSARFNPYRAGLVDTSTNDLEFTSFSHGIHKCPGNKIALMIIRLYIAALISTHDVSFPPNYSMPETSFERATLAQRHGPCKLIIR